MESLIFDVDGTLWDAVALVAEGWNDGLQSMGFAPHCTEQSIRPLFGKTMTEIAQVVVPGVPQEQAMEVMDRCMDGEMARLRRDPCHIFYPGVKETLTELHKTHRLFIVSNCQQGYIELLMEKGGLGGLISDFDCFGNTGLPKGQTLRLLCERCNVRDAVYVGDTEEKVIYLTFDAGYEAGYTEQILDVLKKHDVKAAFFVVGNYIEQNPDLVRRMLREGHIVGNHTYHHYDMSKLSDEAAFNQELTSLETLYRETTGEDLPRYYRPPQGIYSEKNLEMAQKLGYRTVFWSLAYVDWYQDNQPTDEQAFSKLLPRIHPGAVVLLHSTSQTNARILDTLLSKWEEMGYSFGTLDELFA